MDSEAPAGNEIEVFITTIRQMFPNMLAELSVQQSFNPIAAFSFKGPIVEQVGPVNSTINLRFTGKFEDMLRVREFMMSFAYNVAIHEEVDSSGAHRVTCEFIVNGASLRSNRKLYDAQFEMLLEDELSKKPE